MIETVYYVLHYQVVRGASWANHVNNENSGNRHYLYTGSKVINGGFRICFRKKS